MANFANLKAAINAVIKANGQREITGEVMNQVLTAMVNSLGSNYQFAGVATPSTNPGTPDQNVFYMATQAGTYTNFSAIVLQAGISILLWDGSWSSETFFTIDSVPTAGSNNFITSGAVFDKFKLDGGAYDVTAHNNNATFADLSAILNSDNLNTLIPVAVRHGGMSIKFVLSSDNKYVQYRLMNQNWSIVVTDWQGVDEDLIAGSRNFVESTGIVKGDFEAIKPLLVALVSASTPSGNTLLFNFFEGKTYYIVYNGVQTDTTFNGILTSLTTDTVQTKVDDVASYLLVRSGIYSVVKFTATGDAHVLFTQGLSGTGAEISIYSYEERDNVPTYDSNKTAKSGGIYDFFKDLYNIYSPKMNYNANTNLIKFVFEHSYWKGSVEVVNSSAHAFRRSAIIPIAPNKTYVYTGKMIEAAAGPKCFVLDEYLNVVSEFWVDGETSYTINAPNNARYVCLSCAPDAEDFSLTCNEAITIILHQDVLNKIATIESLQSDVTKLKDNFTTSELITSEDIVVGEYYHENGHIQSRSGYSRSELIPVEPNALYKFKGDVHTGWMGYARSFWYKADGTTHSAFGELFNNESSVTPQQGVIIKAPCDAYYVGFSVLGSTMSLEKFTVNQKIDFSKNIHQADNIYGKRIAYFGDSLMAGLEYNPDGTSEDITKGIWGRLNERYDLNMITNQSEGGTCICGTSDPTTLEHAIAYKIAQFNQETDILLFSGGHNDYYNNRPIGELSQSYTPTENYVETIPALDYALYKIRNAYPNVLIVYMLNWKCGETAYNTGVIYTNVFSKIVECCKKWSVPVINLYDNSGITLSLQSQRTVYGRYNGQQGYDNVHLSTAGYERVFPIVCDMFRKLLGLY